MANLNRVLLIGRLTRDPELRYIPSGQAVTELGLAVNETWTGKDGQKKEETTFVDVTLWGRQAELACEYLSKGRQVFIEGKLRLDQWETREGEKRTKLKVTALSMQFLDSKGDRSGGGPPPAESSRPDSDPPGPPARSMEPSGPPEEEIPF
jgi:single-strand DNA-binding protein